MNHLSQLLHFIASRVEAVFKHDPVTNTYTVHENADLPAVARVSPEVVEALHRDNVLIPQGFAVDPEVCATLHNSAVTKLSRMDTRYGVQPKAAQTHRNHFTPPSYVPSPSRRLGSRVAEDEISGTRVAESAIVGLAAGYALSSLFDQEDHSSYISPSSSSSDDSSSSFSSGGGDFSGGGSSSSWESSSSSSSDSSSSYSSSDSSSSYDSGSSSSSDCGSSSDF